MNNNSCRPTLNITCLSRQQRRIINSLLQNSLFDSKHRNLRGQNYLPGIRKLVTTETAGIFVWTITESISSQKTRRHTPCARWRINITRRLHWKFHRISQKQENSLVCRITYGMNQLSIVSIFSVNTNWLNDTKLLLASVLTKHRYIFDMWMLMLYVIRSESEGTFPLSRTLCRSHSHPQGSTGSRLDFFWISNGSSYFSNGNPKF